MHHPNHMSVPWYLNPEVTSQWIDTGQVIFKDSIEIRYTHAHEFNAVLDLVRGSEGIVQPEPERLKRAIEAGRSVIAQVKQSRALIAHQRYELWPDLQLAELRTAFVRPDFRGQGLNTFMKRLLINEVIQRNPDWRLLGYCYPESKSKNIFQRFGFVPVDLTEVKDTWPSLVSDCSTDQCFLKNEYPCNCWVCCLTPQAQT